MSENATESTGTKPVKRRRVVKPKKATKSTAKAVKKDNLDGFTLVGKAGGPRESTASFRMSPRTGNITMTAMAYEQYCLTGFVEVYVNKSTNQIALKFVKEKGKTARKITSVNDYRWSISCRPSVKELGLNPDSESFPLDVVESDKRKRLLVLGINGE